MKPVIDSSGTKIKNLFKNDDGSLVVRDSVGYARNKTSKDAFESINKEVAEMKQQLQLILEKLNG